MAVGTRINLQGVQGSTFAGTFTLVNGDGSQHDLTGATAQMEVRASYGATAILLTISSSNGGLTMGGTAGTIGISIAASAMQGLPVATSTVGPTSPGAPVPGTYFVYDLLVTYPNGTVERRFFGTLFVSASVTHT